MKGGGGEWERMQVIGEQVKEYVQYGIHTVTIVV